MTEGELDFILRKLKRYFKGREKKPVIIFHAAEPLLVKEIIFDAIRRYSKNFKFGLQTNATLLAAEDVEFLKRFRVGVGISLDASVPSVNNRSRVLPQGGGNFSRAVKAIELFDGYEGLNVIATVTKFNVRGLSDLVKFLHRKKVPAVLLNPVRFTQPLRAGAGFTGAPIRALKPNERVLTKHFIEAVDTAIELSKNRKRKIVVANFANIILAIVAPAARRMMCDISPCGGGRCFFTITASGNMIPCGEFIGLKRFVGGNIFKDPISKAMESRPFKRIRARIVEKIAKCRECPLRNICGAPCPAELHSLGDMYQPSIFCEFYKAIIKHALKIIAEGKEGYCLRPEGAFKYEYNVLSTKARTLNILR